MKRILLAVSAAIIGAFGAFAQSANLALQGNNESTGEATITFDAAFAGADGTAIFRADKVSMNLAQIATVEAGVTTFTDMKMAWGKQYVYRVAPIDGGVVGALSEDSLEAMRLRRIERDPAVSNAALREGVKSLALVATTCYPEKAFDGDAGTFCENWISWHSYYTMYSVVGLDFGETYHVARYRAHGANLPERINQMRLWGSNDDDAIETASKVDANNPDGFPTAFNALCEKATALSAELVYAGNQWYDVPVDYTEAYRYFYVWAPQQPGDGWGWCADLSELELFGWASSDETNVEITDRSRDGDSVSLSLLLNEKLAGGQIYAISASNESALLSAEGTAVGETLASGESFRYITFEIGDGDTCVCLKVVVGESIFYSDAIAIDDIPERASSQPSGAFSGIKAEEAGVTISVLVSSLGADAENCDIHFVYGATPEKLEHDVVVQTVSEAGLFNVPVDGLRPGATYYGQILLNNGGEPVVISGVVTFEIPAEKLIPGINMDATICQARVFNNSWALGFDILGSSDLGTVDGCMALHYSDYTPWTVTHPDGTTDTCTWCDNVTFGYLFYMYFDATEYAFTGLLDDNCNVYISDDPNELGTLVLVTTYGNRDTRTWTCPKAGLYKVTIYAGNGGGGFGSYGGIPGASWRKTDGTDGYEWYDGSTGWNTFTDAYHTRFFMPVEAPVPNSEILNGSRATVTVTFPLSAVGGTAKVFWNDSYAGSNTSDWQRVEGDFGALGSSGAMDYVFTVPEGAKYLRYAIETPNGFYWTVASPIEEMTVIDAAKPSYRLTAIENESYGTADFAGAVIACGGDYEVCDIVVEYGYTEDDLDSVQTFGNCAAGVNTVTLLRLAPDHVYYARIFARNASGDESEKSEIVSFRTGPLVVPNPIAGLYEAHGPQWINYATEMPNCHRVLQTYAVDNYFNGTQLHWPGWDMEGNAVTVDGANACYYRYEGYIHLDDTDYYVFTDVDDHAWLYINGVCYYDAARNWGGSKIDVSEQEWWTGPGWYKFAIETQDGGGGAGPWDGKIIGAGWNTNGWTTVDTSSSSAGHWNYFRDPGDASFLRVNPGARDIKVVTTSVEEGKFVADLSLAAWQNGDEVQLYVAYGKDYCGQNTNDWDDVEMVAMLTRDMKAYAFEGKTGARDTYDYVWFFTVADDGSWQWCGQPICMPDTSRPAFGPAGIAYDGDIGDTIIARGQVALTGAGATATLKILVSENEDLSDGFVYEYTDLEAKENFEVRLYTDDTTSAKYIKPGTTYYLRASLVGTDGKSDILPVQSVATYGGADFDSVLANDVNEEVSLYGVVWPLGRDHQTTVYYYAGFDQNNLGLVGSQEVDENGNYGLVHTVDHVKDTLYYRIVVSNACSTAVWTKDSGVRSIFVRDQYIYYWNEEVHEGSWTDSKNWIVNGNPPQATYPDNAACQAAFEVGEENAKIPYVITVDPYVGVSQLYFNTQGMDLTFVGTKGYGADDFENNDWSLDHGSVANQYSGIYVANWLNHFAANVKLRLKDIYFHLGSGIDMTNGDELHMDHAFFYAGNDMNANGTPILFNVCNRSVYRQSGGYFHSKSYDFHFILDDSVVWGAGGGAFNLANDPNWSGGKQVLEIGGKYAYIEMANHLLHVGTSGAGENLTAELIFHVPVGGFYRPPLGVYQSTFYWTSATPLKISVAKDSPARNVGKRLTTNLVYSDYGFSYWQEHDKYLMDFSPEDRPVIGYSTDGKYIQADIPNSGFKVFVK